MSQTIDAVYRDYNTSGVPASGDHKPKKAEIRALLKQIQNSGGSSVTRNTLVALQAVTPPTENYGGIVLDDPTASNNGYYSRVAAAWVWERGFPDTFAELTVTGGTGNAVQAAVEAGVSPGDVEVFFIEPTSTNSGAVTLSVGGATAKPVNDVNGDALTAGLDEANIALRGKVLADSLDLPMVHSHAQARRLAKIHTHKSNPEWVGTIVTNFYGFNALGEETVRVKFGPLGIDTTFLVQSVRILDDLTGVQLSLTSLTGSAYDWDAALEEGTGPNTPPDTSTPISLDPPADFNVTAAELVIDGTVVGTYLPATWTEPSRVSLAQEVEYRVQDDPAWLNMAVTDGQGFAQSTAVTADAIYEVRARTRSPGGVYSSYSAIIPVVATADTTIPASVTGVVAVGVSGGVDFDATHSVTTNSVGTRIYRNTVNNFGTSALVSTQYGSPGIAFSYTRSDTAGTRYFWLVSINGAGDEGTPVATGAVIVT